MHSPERFYTFRTENIQLYNLHFKYTANPFDSPEVAKVLKAEIKVWLGDREQAKSYLQNCHVDFKISIDSSETEYYKIFGDKIINYSDTTVKLLLQELNEEYDTLLTNWKSHESKWGYWDMLKRTKKAMDVTGCKEYELLMPIPNDEIMFDPNQSQNPGY